jgi:3',5'-cyclic AMP phosphodiesterase CpdA
MLTWLENDLAATDKQWIIAYWHHPPYSKGSHDSDLETWSIEMRTNVLPILEAHGVDLVLTGHSHSYERSYLLNGHYGSSTTLTSGMVLDAGDGPRTETAPRNQCHGHTQ